MKTILRSNWPAAFCLLAGLYFASNARAQLPNAWQITDHTQSAVTANYSTNLPAPQQSAALTNGWRYSINARLADDFGDTATMVFYYGVGTNRFSVFWDLDSNGDLTATPYNQTTLTLTTNGSGADFYHTYEIVYSPTNRQAAFLFDGIQRTTWSGDGVTNANGLIAWGSGSSAGQGKMNFHTVTFAVGTNGAASYDAGNSPTNAPDPRSQGWTANGASATITNAVSPDAVALPTIAIVTTSAAANVQPQRATLRGTVNSLGLGANTWFEWGTTTNYGNTTPAIFLRGDPNQVQVSQVVTGLLNSTAYHSRCVATNLMGPVYGVDIGFATPPTMSVNTLASSGSGSLRQAIADADHGDTITFATNGTIVLTSGQLTISDNLTIIGPGPANLILDGNDNSRIFQILEGVSVNISSLTVIHGHGQDGSAGSLGSDGSSGGGIHNSGNLALTNCIITGNRAGNGGDGKDGDGLTLDDGGDGSRGGDGGGIFNDSTAKLTLVSCTLSYNGAGNGGRGGNGYQWHVPNPNGHDGGRGGSGGSGGGIYIGTTTIVTLIACTLDHNHTGAGRNGGAGGFAILTGDGGSGGDGGDAGDGGGIFASKNLQVDASTLSYNFELSKGSGGAGGQAQGSGSPGAPGSDGTGGSGGGICGIFPVRLTANCSSIVSNTASFGGGVFGGILYLTNTIVAGNTSTNFGGSLLLIAGNCLTNGNPLLAPLGDYGGPTWTMPPLPGSPAIDTGTDFVTNSLSTDQRGGPRLYGAHVDIGAVEFRPSIVLNTNDAGIGSLRDTIIETVPQGIVTFDPSLAGRTIHLPGGQILIERNLTVDASALAGGVTIDGDGNSRHFEIDSGSVTLNSLTLTNGHTSGNGGGILVDTDAALTINNSTLAGNSANGGGGLYNNKGTLTVRNCTVAGNSANFGGGLDNHGILTINDSILSGNFANNSGGGIYSEQATSTVNHCSFSGNSASFGGGIDNEFGTLTVNNSTLSGNSATNNGGGIDNGSGGAVIVNSSTLSSNSASFGGGILSFGGMLTVNGSTLSGNSAFSGGGVVNASGALVTVNNSTLSGNSASFGGGIRHNTTGGTSVLTNTIVAGNTAPNNPNIRIEAGTLSIVNSLTNGPPLLASLGDYGGPTQTMPPLAGSPAIDAGSDSIVSLLPTDQRGYARKSGAHVDIGAVEVQVADPDNPPRLTQPTRQANGASLLSFTNGPGISFSVYASTNVAMPLNLWTKLGTATQSAFGQYQFTDTAATNYGARFYQVTWP